MLNLRSRYRCYQCWSRGLYPQASGAVWHAQLQPLCVTDDCRHWPHFYFAVRCPWVPDKDIVAAYVNLVGELFYICINTVPEIMYALSALTWYMTRATSQHYGYVKQVLRYLKGVKHLKLTWCRSLLRGLARKQKRKNGAWQARSRSRHGCVLRLAA